MNMITNGLQNQRQSIHLSGNNGGLNGVDKSQTQVSRLNNKKRLPELNETYQNMQRMAQKAAINHMQQEQNSTMNNSNNQKAQYSTSQQKYNPNTSQ